MTTPPVTVGQTIPVHLDSLAIGGECVGRYQGMAVFATWGCPGDEAEVEITEVASRFARGVVRKVLSPSPDRIPAPCPHFGDCGGCQLQHTAYPAQLRHKTSLVKDAVSRLAGLSGVEVAEAWGMDDPWRYRGRAQYHARLEPSGQVVFGFARYHSHDIFSLTECALQHPLSEQIRAAALRLLSRVAQGAAERAALLGLETVVSYAAEQALAVLVCEGRPPFVGSLAESLMQEVPGLVGVCVARQRGRGAPRRSPAELVVGRSHLVERLGEGAYRLSPDSFFQVNPRQAARVLSLVSEWADVGPSEVVVDAYCGVGTFLLPLARAARQAGGIEAEESALSDARANLRHWRLANTTLYHGRVERVLPRLAERGRRADVVVLDPPRKGCGPVVCEAAARLQPRRILLVSCHPATLARDLKLLAGHGYPARRLQPVDMFPQTWHVEALALCERA
jgi:23S rRNA (uracil1939-C5)-methyltransferase